MYNSNSKSDACEFEFRLVSLSQNIFDRKNKCPWNRNAERDMYDYYIIPEQKIMTCSICKGKVKIKIVGKENRFSLSVLVSTKTMCCCVLKLQTF